MRATIRRGHEKLEKRITWRCDGRKRRAVPGREIHGKNGGVSSCTKSEKGTREMLALTSIIIGFVSAIANNSNNENKMQMRGLY